MPGLSVRSRNREHAARRSRFSHFTFLGVTKIATWATSRGFTENLRTFLATTGNQPSVGVRLAIMRADFTKPKGDVHAFF
jgi:hypothetical protein